ncbi:Cytoplasmic and mitochondrial histidine tRNA synthetase [Saitozyma podzolica]|uniref:histidine--tRNA ligase n=1 Tax=Saitozyma podzolica TaxID=1890683 RepID=A0A427YUM9_9TREE|nr:Cytoplasmic and mitochondrial histidine tRNA synthetase [Saitozyma podzolica]
MTAASSSVAERIAALQTRIKELKVAKQDATAEVDEMKALKEQLGKDKKSGSGFQLKTPKGTVDHRPEATLLRKKIFHTLESIFVKYGASTIDTPVFELREILAGKYGEDSKLIYDLQDQGGELCSLRYDLTVPFARYLAMNGITSMKRYHIGKVYRRDQPVVTKGRMREFFQCDFDIAGVYDSMVPDAEVLSFLCDALTALDIGEFTVKMNHRKILDGIFELAGVPQDKTRSISSAVDKLDKMSWADVRKEMTVDKGLDPVIADKIGEYVGLKGPGWDVLKKLEADEKLMGIESAKAGLADMRLLFEYLEVFGVLDKMSFDMSLARGLDYYTGLIYEAITEFSAPPSARPTPSVPAPDAMTSSTPTSLPAKADKKAKSSDKDKAKTEDDAVDEASVGVGSIAAGGRYDNLVGMFAEAAGQKRDQVPCVGISIGVERVYSIMEMRRKNREEKIRGKETDVYVLALGGGLLKERMAFAKMLRDNGIKTEFMYKAKPKAPAQWKAADDDHVPIVAILAPAELESGTVRIKQQVGKDAAGEENKGVEVKVEEAVAYIKQRL